MQEDKKLQSLLNKYAMQEPSEGFDEQVMQLIEASTVKHPASILNPILLRVLMGVFITALLLLLLATFFIQPASLPVHFNISLPQNVYMQVFSFFAAFWVVMLVNLWWNKRNNIISLS